ncbi:hypothetical protein MOV08_05205 [Streptomyces yunnanensis]|uniref:DUF4054 domain-containing protein n=1 Tax=Streptomyces yunnanensis TaxID=156453 RepID=A0ABY8A4D7_9ACTN|nr:MULTISPECIES: hypothetical protein [Streptomyces]WEB38760.1 hypothetical protein MOV08_05205 [Streptomyces yunnanensis]
MATFEFDPEFSKRVARTDEVGQLCHEKALQAAKYAYAHAPKRHDKETGKAPHPDSYAANLKTESRLTADGWKAVAYSDSVNWGFLEFGFKDRAGRWHAGLHLLSRGLKASRY